MSVLLLTQLSRLGASACYGNWPKNGFTGRQGRQPNASCRSLATENVVKKFTILHIRCTEWPQQLPSRDEDNMRRALSLLMFLSMSMLALAGDWPQFRGPTGQGHSDATGLPVAWSETANITWKTPIEGRGWSSPVIFGDQIWMTTAIATRASEEAAKQHLKKLPFPIPSPEVASRIILKAVCVDRKTGRPRHATELFDVNGPLHICAVNSYASPTPVVEEGRLYCDFGAMGTACLDTKSGTTIWKRTLPIMHQVGPGSSPAVFEDLLILVRDGCDVQYLTALDKATGDTSWKTPRPPIASQFTPYKKAFSTPLVIEHDGQLQMIVPGAQWIASYEPRTGNELWRVNTGGTFSNSSRAVYGKGLVFVSTAYGGTELFAIRPDGRGDVTESHVVWSTRKQAPRMPSPLLVGNQLYTISDSGVATCMDAATGEVHWARRLLGDCSASPTFVDGRVYFCGKDGTTAVIRPGVEFALLAKSKLEGRVMASMAIADEAIFLRSDTHLYRIED
jgi:outer membrane protein assembly factor BamB